MLCNLGTLASGGAATIVLNVRPTIGGSHTNQAIVSANQADPVATDNTALTTVSTGGPGPSGANLALTMSDAPDPVSLGTELTYLLSVTNLGPDAASNVAISDVLPANVTIVSASSPDGSCSGVTTVSCAFGTVASGANVSATIVVTPTAAGLLTNTATVTTSGTDPDDANNTATTATTVNAAGP